ncbi:UxaA family hydrolase [Candidatus Pacearchaeota archaeon]|nr:UxaA family hydrolase [Candidatus Pacearchaeota archaeon]
MKSFLGFPRKQGPAGIRNYIVVIAAELSCNPWVTRIASVVRGPCCAITHKHGIGDRGSDQETFLRIITGILCHPNVAGGLLVASGNEDYDPAPVVARALTSGRRARVLSLKDFSRTESMLAKGARLARELAREAGKAKRVEFGLEQLRVGLNCAGTDRFSGTTSHAVCGAAVDRLIEGGGTALLTEIPEMIGLGKRWFDRAADRDVRKRLQSLIIRHKKRLSVCGGDISDNEVCAFNVAGGMSCLAEKSAVSILKAGTSRITQVVRYGETPAGTGLVVMDGPALTDFAIVGLMGSGAHLMLNCCGAGSANRMPFVVGADMPSPILPVIKLTGSAPHFRRQENRIDFSADFSAGGGRSTNNRADRLFNLIMRVASGARTRTEEAEEGKRFFVNFPMRFYQA